MFLLLFFYETEKLSALLSLHIRSIMVHRVANIYFYSGFYEIKASLTKSNQFFVKGKAASENTFICFWKHWKISVYLPKGVVLEALQGVFKSP